MNERFIINPQSGMGFRVGQGERPAERIRFAPQADTLRSFMAGKGHPEDKRLEMAVNGKAEVWHLHEPGFMDAETRIVSLGAHPDDTAIEQGLSYVINKQGKEKGAKSTALAVITATTGHEGGDPEKRVPEDIAGAKELDAHVYGNLGFTDKKTQDEFYGLYERYRRLFRELSPHIVVVPDPDDDSHLDHVQVALAARAALLDNGQAPILLYADHQFGISEFGEDSFGYILDSDDMYAYERSSKAHATQKLDQTPDGQRVLARPSTYAEDLFPDNKHIKFVGVGRQDTDTRFSQEPISNYLRIVPLHGHVEPKDNQPFFVKDREVHEESPSVSYLTRAEIQTNLPIIKDRLTKVMVDATGWSRELCEPRIDARADNFDLLVVATQGEDLLSFGGYTLYEVDKLGTVLYESVKMTARDAQGQGLGKRITRTAVERLGPDYFALRTQNPAEVASVLNTLKNSTFAPIDHYYSEDPALHAGVSFMGDVLEMEEFDPDTGLCIGFYGQKVGDYAIDTSIPQIDFIHQRLLDLGLNRDRGDAILMMGKVEPEGSLVRNSSGTIFTANVS